MKKILILSTIGLNYVGITSVIKNYIAAMDTTGLEFCFVAFPEIPESLKKDFETYGSVCCITNRKKSFFSYLIDIIGLMRQGFHTVHIHGNSGTMLIEVLLARLCGIRNVTFHQNQFSANQPYFEEANDAPGRSVHSLLKGFRRLVVRTLSAYHSEQCHRLTEICVL